MAKLLISASIFFFQVKGSNQLSDIIRRPAKPIANRVNTHKPTRLLPPRLFVKANRSYTRAESTAARPHRWEYWSQLSEQLLPHKGWSDLSREQLKRHATWDEQFSHTHTRKSVYHSLRRVIRASEGKWVVTAAVSPQASGHHLHLPVKVSSLVTGGGREGRQQFNVLGVFLSD